MTDEGTAYHNGEHDPARTEGCETVEVTAKLWLEWRDGRWTVFGIGQDEIDVYDANDHQFDLTDDQQESLGAFLSVLEQVLDARVPA